VFRFCITGVEMQWFFEDFCAYANRAGFALIGAFGQARRA
jgi:hypothetical protein